MLEQELKDIWNNSTRTTKISIETNLLVEELNVKVNSIQKKIRIRDVGEISASVIGILIFGYLLYEIPFPITRISCIFSIVWFAYVIFKFSKSKKQQPSYIIHLKPPHSEPTFNVKIQKIAKTNKKNIASSKRSSEIRSSIARLCCALD